MSGAASEASEGQRPLTRALFAMAAGAVAIGIGLWSRHRYALDDAFISYRYARHLIEGLGPVYNAGERVEGYTSPLWVLLNAPGLALGLDPLVVSRILGLACFALIPFVAARILAPLLERPRDLWLGVPLLALGLTAHHVDFMASGLEPGLWSLCVLALGRQLLAQPGVRRDALINLLCLALLLTRLDGAPFVAMHIVVSARQLFRQQLGQQWARGPALRTLLRRYGPFVVVFTLLMAGKHAYYGAWLPNTFTAKYAGLGGVGSGISYLVSFVASYPHLSLAVPLAVLGALRPPRAEYGPFAAWAGSALLLYYAYLLVVGGDFMMYRLALQPYATLMVLCALGLARLLALAARPARAFGLVLLCLSPGWPRPDPDYYMQSMEEMQRYSELGTQVGLTLKRVLPPDTVIATTLAGTLPYHSQLTTIDQLGLNDRWVARHGALFPRSRGHTRHAPREYLADRGVQLVFEHPASPPCSRLPSTGSARVFVRIGQARCVGADYLVRTPKLTVHLCEHPEWFVLDQVRCPDTTRLHGLQLLGSQLRRSTWAPVRVEANDAVMVPPSRARRTGELRSRREPGASTNPAAVR